MIIYLKEQRNSKKRFVSVTDFTMLLKMGKRIHLCEYEANALADGLNNLFSRNVEIRKNKHKKRQTFETQQNVGTTTILKIQ